VINVLQLVLSWTTSIPDTLLVAIAIQVSVGLQQLQIEQDAVHGHQSFRPAANEGVSRVTNGHSTNVPKRGTAFTSTGRSSEDPHRGRQDQPFAGAEAQQEKISRPARWTAGSGFAANNDANIRGDEEVVYPSERCLPTDASSALHSENLDERSTLDGPLLVPNTAATRTPSAPQMTVRDPLQRSAADTEEFTSAYDLARLRRRTGDGPLMESASRPGAVPLSWWWTDRAA
jgi:hypothetical protein